MSSVAEISIMKISKERVYWVVHQSTPAGVERVLDGFCSTREVAVAHALAVLKRYFPAVAADVVARQKRTHPPESQYWNWLLKEYGAGYRSIEWVIWYWITLQSGTRARELYRRHHVKQKVANSSNTRGDLGTIWSVTMNWGLCDWFLGRNNYLVLTNVKWTPHPITKITKGRIFVLSNAKRVVQRALNRAELEQYGITPSEPHRLRKARYAYLTEDRKRFEEARLARYLADRDAMHRRWGNGRSGTGTDVQDACDALGLSGQYSRAEVMRAFRRKAQEHHPDKGGDPAMFRRLVAAKELALAGAR
jgi:hypothetical protein